MRATLHTVEQKSLSRFSKASFQKVSRYVARNAAVCVFFSSVVYFHHEFYSSDILQQKTSKRFFISFLITKIMVQITGTSVTSLFGMYTIFASSNLKLN